MKGESNKQLSKMTTSLIFMLHLLHLWPNSIVPLVEHGRTWGDCPELDCLPSPVLFENKQRREERGQAAQLCITATTGHSSWQRQNT